MLHAFRYTSTSAKRHLSELDPDDLVEELHELGLSAPRPWTRELQGLFRRTSTNSITVLLPTFDDFGPELGKRVLARLESHRNASQTAQLKSRKSFPCLIPKE